jgi:hypothetical protein
MVGAAAYSRSREAGGTPIICEACAKAIGKFVGLVEPVPVSKKEYGFAEGGNPSSEPTPAKKTATKKAAPSKAKKE